jgi:hypothetical protein
MVLNRRSVSFVAFIASLIFSSLMCDMPGDRESDDAALLEAQSMTAIAVEATRFSRNLTATAQASITPSAQPTHTPTAPPTSTGNPSSTGIPTSTPPLPAATSDGSYYTFDSNNLPAAVYSVTDPLVIPISVQPVEDLEIQQRISLAFIFMILNHLEPHTITGMFLLNWVYQRIQLS